MRLIKICFIFIFSIVLVGCTKQPERIGSSSYPEIQLLNKDTKTIQNKLVARMLDKGYYLVESTDFKIDFRKDFLAGEDSVARAIMQASDGSTVDSKGIEYTIYSINNQLIIKGKSYLYKTFSYNKKAPEKFDLTNNNAHYNHIQTILNELNN